MLSQTQKRTGEQKNRFSKKEDNVIRSFLPKNGLNSLKADISVLPNGTIGQIREILP
jgi:hypothetical protein